MFKLSCIAACALAVGLAASASAQTTVVNPFSLSTFGSNGVLLSIAPTSAAIKFGDIFLTFSPNFGSAPSATSGNFINNTTNQGSASFSFSPNTPPGSGLEDINLFFPSSQGATDYASGDVARFQVFSFSNVTVSLDPSKLDLYDTSFNKITFIGNPTIIVLRMEAVPEPGTCALGLALTGGLFALGIRHRKRNQLASAS